MVGHGAGLRVENRLPGGDVNPYLARRRRCSPGPARHREQIPLEPAFDGNAYVVGQGRRCPPRWPRPATLFAGSAVARAAFGDDVVDHYVNAADVELAAFNAAVTDWERIRGFERL